MRFEITSDNHILTIPEALPQEAGVLLGVADALVSHVRGWSGGSAFADDFTVVLLQRL